ncbi:MAG: hypothetical protein OHK0037_07180 [Elainellaceae cyanobacterium]
MTTKLAVVLAAVGVPVNLGWGMPAKIYDHSGQTLTSAQPEYKTETLRMQNLRLSRGKIPDNLEGLNVPILLDLATL